MIDLYEEHKKKFGSYPKKIGMIGLDEEDVLNDISKAIEDNKPYNEYNLLTNEDKKAYDNGSLVF